MKTLPAALLLLAAIAAPAVAQDSASKTTTTSTTTHHSVRHTAHAARRGIPAGTYTTAIAREDAAGKVGAAMVDSLTGNWAIAIDSTGHFTVQHDGKEVVRGVAVPRAGSHVDFHANDTGTVACHLAGSYHYVVKGDSLTFHKVSDRCRGRIVVLTSHTMAKGS